MKKASDQVLSAVKQFVTTAVKVGLPLKEMKPTPIITTHPVSMLSPVSNSPVSKSPEPAVQHYSNLEFVMSLERFTRSVVLMVFLQRKTSKFINLVVDRIASKKHSSRSIYPINPASPDNRN